MNGKAWEVEGGGGVDGAAVGSEAGRVPSGWEVGERVGQGHVGQH